MNNSTRKTFIKSHPAVIENPFSVSFKVLRLENLDFSLAKVVREICVVSKVCEKHFFYLIGYKSFPHCFSFPPPLFPILLVLDFPNELLLGPEKVQ
jgi:hypothetical protein